MPIQKPFVVEPVPLGTIATGNEKTNRKASFLGRFEDQGMVWESSSASNIWARGDFGANQDVDFVALLGTNATASTRARLRLGDTQGEVDGTADYDSGAQVIRTPALTHHSGLYHWYWELPSTQSERWWRIDVDNHTGDFRAMALIMGKRLQFADFYNQTGFSFGMEDMGSIDFGRFGINAREDGIKMRTLGMEFGWMSEADRADKFQPLRDRLGSTGIAYWCFDGEPTAQRQDKQYLGWLRRPMIFQPSTFKQDRFQTQVEIVSII